MFHSFGAPEAAVIVVIVLIVFGVGKLPQVGGALGKGIREFRKGKSGEDDKPRELEQPNEEENKQDS
jgi:sec-independent protein translocase protein TatA